MEKGRSYMAIQIGQRKTRVVIAFVLGAATAASFAQSRSFASQPPAEAAPSGYTAPMGLTGDDIIGKMLERNRLRNEQLQRYSALRTYEIRNLEERSRLRQWCVSIMRRPARRHSIRPPKKDP